MITNTISTKLLNADFYTGIINDQDTYNRIYDEVLLDDQFRDTTQGFFGDIEVVSHEDIVGLLAEVAPPEYLQSQVGQNIQRSVDYMSGDGETLELYVELEQPLDTVKPALLAYIDGRIDQLDAVEPDPTKGLLEQIAEVQSSRRC